MLSLCCLAKALPAIPMMPSIITAEPIVTVGLPTRRIIKKSTTDISKAAATTAENNRRIAITPSVSALWLCLVMPAWRLSSVHHPGSSYGLDASLSLCLMFRSDCIR
jgi:hypothetical protein